MEPFWAGLAVGCILAGAVLHVMRRTVAATVLVVLGLGIALVRISSLGGL